jgi:hypothetical protein
LINIFEAKSGAYGLTKLLKKVPLHMINSNEELNHYTLFILFYRKLNEFEWIQNKKNSTEDYPKFYNFNEQDASKYNVRRLYFIKKYLRQNLLIPSSKLNINISNRLIIINFIKKERLYTKLKYSRSPAYDIVSGGAAALLAGFLGFLISEKYGFELVDSGDFYYFFMYAVFFSFSLRPLLTSMNNMTTLSDLFSIKYFFDYFFFFFSLNRIILS